MGQDDLFAVSSRESAKTVSGYRMSQGWAKDQRVYFVAEFSQPVKLESNERDTIGVFAFDNAEQPLLVKVGISAVSVENARLNMQKELPGWDFRNAVAQAKDEWNRELSKIAIKLRTRVQERYSIQHCITQ